MKQKNIVGSQNLEQTLFTTQNCGHVKIRLPKPTCRNNFHLEVEFSYQIDALVLVSYIINHQNELLNYKRS